MNRVSKYDQSEGRLHALKFLAVMGITLAMVPGLLRGAGSPDQLPLDEFIKEVQQSYHDVHALRADFTQTYVSGSRTRVESGTVVFARGGRMRWDYREPGKKLFLSDGKEVLLYLPAENQLNRSSVKASEDFRVPFRLLLSRLDLRKVFSKFEDAADAFQHDPDDRVIRAYPKHGEQEGYKQVVMEFDPELDIRRLELVYTDNSVMKFEFEHIDRNPQLAASLFHFTPPPGTEVIAQH
ncbi:MAG TPA: outer membrane lipoprotein carrier protein LolA [Terriglobia bacterium]|nr:outer membrane lipoprotein carrier protein LolA [Terriglobia bacterium]